MRIKKVFWAQRGCGNTVFIISTSYLHFLPKAILNPVPRKKLTLFMLLMYYIPWITTKAIIEKSRSGRFGLVLGRLAILKKTLWDDYEHF